MVKIISPLAWILGSFATANVIAMFGVLYIAFGTPIFCVLDGHVDESVHNTLDVEVRDRALLGVQVAEMP